MKFLDAIKKLFTADAAVAAEAEEKRAKDFARMEEIREKLAARPPTRKHAQKQHVDHSGSGQSASGNTASSENTGFGFTEFLSKNSGNSASDTAPAAPDRFTSGGGGDFSGGGASGGWGGNDGGGNNSITSMADRVATERSRLRNDTRKA